METTPELRASLTTQTPSTAGATEGSSPTAEALEQLHRLGGDSLVQEIIELFRTDGREKLNQLVLASDEADGEALAFVAHSLITTAGTLGAARLQNLATELESRATEDAASLRTTIDEIVTEFGRVEDWLDQHEGSL